MLPLLAPGQMESIQIWKHLAILIVVDRYPTGTENQLKLKKNRFHPVVELRTVSVHIAHEKYDFNELLWNIRIS